MTHHMTLFCATVQGQAGNSYYPNSQVITSAADLGAVVVWDHVAAGYAGGHRANKNFITSDCLVMDVDNDHTDNPDEWVTPDALPTLLPGVTVATAPSRKATAGHDSNRGHQNGANNAKKSRQAPATKPRSKHNKTQKTA